MSTQPLHYNDATRQLKAWIAGVYSTVSAVITGSEVTKTTTGNIDDLDFSNATTIRMNNATDATIRGMVAGIGGQRVTIVSIGAGNVLLAHQNAGSAVANRLINTATSGVTPLAAGTGYAGYEYDATTARWRLVLHEQGAELTRTFAAGDYTGDGTIVWSVDAGDVQFTYYLKGRQLKLSGALSATTTSGSASTNLKTLLPNSYTAARFAVQPARISEAAVTYRAWGISYVNVSDTNLNFQKVDVSNFALGVDNLTIQLTNVIEIT